MQKLTRLILVAMALIAIALPSTSVAKDKRKKKERERHAAVITSVSPTALSLLENKIKKTVAITPATEIYIRGEKPRPMHCNRGWR